jgi:hypothetical protein
MERVGFVTYWHLLFRRGWSVPGQEWLFNAKRGGMGRVNGRRCWRCGPGSRLGNPRYGGRGPPDTLGGSAVRQRAWMAARFSPMGAIGSTGQTTSPPLGEPHLVGRGSCRADRSKIRAARFVAAPRERRPTFLLLHWRDGFRQSDRRTELHPEANPVLNHLRRYIGWNDHPDG